MGKKHWVKDAIKKPGALKKAAAREGESPSKYIAEHAHDSGKAGQRARLAKTLTSMREKRYGKD